MSALSCESEESDAAGLVLVLLGVERRERAALERAQHDLTAALAATDRPVPCQVSASSLWLSDSPELRLEATRRCRSCPVIAECAAVADAVPSQAWGVFGGHDYTAESGLAELRLIAAAAVRGPGGGAARARRDEVLVELGRTRRWEHRQLADAAGVTTAVVTHLLRDCGVSRRRTDTELVELEQVTGPMLRELRAMGRGPGVGGGDLAWGRRDYLLAQVWETDPVYWSADRLATAAGVSRSEVRAVVRHCRRGGEQRQRRRRPPAESDADRLARFRADAEASADPRVGWLLMLSRQLRELRGSSWSPDLVRDRDGLARQRAELVTQLWAEDSRYWTQHRLVAVLDCGVVTIRRILREAQHNAETGGLR